MTVELNKEEKLSVIDSHKKNLDVVKYNLEINIIEESAKTSPDQATLDYFNIQIDSVNSQISALVAERATVAALD